MRDHDEVERVRTGYGGGFICDALNRVCIRHPIEYEMVTADSPPLNVVAERCLGIIESTSLAARIQTPLRFPRVNVQTNESLWSEAALWSCKYLNKSASFINLDCISPDESWYGKGPEVIIGPFLKSCFYRMSKRKNQPRSTVGIPLIRTWIVSETPVELESI